MTNAAVRSLSTITQLFNQYGTALLTNASLRPLLNGESDTDLASAIAQYSTKALSRVTFWEWVNIYSWRPGLITTLAQKLDAAHIIAMMNALNADTTLVTYLSRDQLISVFAKTGAHYVATLHQYFLCVVNTSDLVAALFSRPIDEIRTLTDADWIYIGQFQPKLKSLIMNPSAELQREITSLPLDFQTRFKTILSDAGLAAFTNPLLSPTELVTKSFLGSTLQKGNDFITLFDQYYAQYLAKAPTQYGALIAFYTQVVSRKAFSSLDLTSTTIGKDFNQFLNLLTTTRNTVQNTTGNLNKDQALAYTANVKASLASGLGQFKNFTDCLADMDKQIIALSNSSLDPTTRIKFDSRIIEYFLNNPSADGSSTLSYAGKSGLNFRDAVLSLEKDLILEADQYIKNINAGLTAGARQKNFADYKDTLTSVFDGVGTFVSLISGFGRTNLAIQNNSALGTIINYAKDITNVTNTVSSLIKSEMTNWFSPSKSALSDTPFYTKLSDSVSDLYTILKRYGVVATLGQEVGTFLADFKSMVTNINNSLNREKDVLGTYDGTFFDTYDHFKYFGVPDLFMDYKDFNGTSQHAWINTFGRKQSNEFTIQGPKVAGYMKTDLVIKDEVTINYKLNFVSVVTHANLYGYNPV